jgi:calcineurin-like phosphoesterase family protein
VNIWITSDTHFGHNNIIKYCDRPFSSYQEMDDCLIDNINSRVYKGDILWHLGDWAFGIKQDYFARCVEYRRRIRCENINFIWGNHDQRVIYGLFKECYDSHYVVLKGEHFYLNHYANVVWPGSHKGTIHLFAHSHSTLNPWIAEHIPNGRLMDVGVDSVARILGDGKLRPENYRPLNIKEVLGMMAARKGFNADRHGTEEKERFYDADGNVSLQPKNNNGEQTVAVPQT